MTSIEMGRDARVLGPESPGWDEARRAWNLAVDQQPEAIAAAESPADVAAAVHYARQHALRVAPQGTGHGASALGSLAGTLLLKTDRMRGVRIDADARIARIEAGTLWHEALDASAPHGLTPLFGSARDVGAVGYLLGGGLSFLGRKLGLAAHSIVAAELVTADGTLLRADETENEDVLWALRGGGGNFGVVTSLEVRLFPLSEVYAGILWFPFERASEVLHAWAELTRGGLPDDLTTVGRVLQLPPLPDIPEPLRGKSFAIVEAIHTGDPAEADALLAPLRALAPAMDTIGTISLPELSHMHMDPEHPVPGIGDGLALETLPDEAVDEFVHAVGPGSGSPLVSVEIRQLGGALARPRPEHAALAAAEGEYVLWAVGVAATPELATASETRIGALRQALLPWTAPRIVPNFADTSRPETSFWNSASLARLRVLKETLDPEDVFRSNHPIGSEPRS